MTELRKRMIESLQLRGLSERTQEAYVRAVGQLGGHYHKSADLITEEEHAQYFLHIKNVKKYSRASSTIAIWGIKFFYEKTLNREFTTLKLVRAPREKKLPVNLSVEEVLTILGRVRLPRYRVCLGTIYFEYKDPATDQVRFCTVSAEEFMRRFLQHVLPERFVKVRYYGLLSPGNRHLLKRAREAHGTRASGSRARSEAGARNQREPVRCPSCGNEMTLIATLSARGREPP